MAGNRLNPYEIVFLHHATYYFKDYSVDISCVIAMKEESMLGLALADLFNGSENELTLIKSEAESYDEFVKEFNNNHANVILLDKSCPFANEDTLAKLIMLFPKILVIIFSEESNWLKIFRREDVLITSSADLMNVIAPS